MKNAVIMIQLLLLSSGPAYAEWVSIGENDNGMTTYVDPDTIHRKGDRVKMWHIFDEKIKRTARGISFLSTRALTEYDCAEERFRTLALSGHSDNMARGKRIYFESDVDKWEPVPPGTPAQILWKIACSKQ